MHIISQSYLRRDLERLIHLLVPSRDKIERSFKKDLIDSIYDLSYEIGRRFLVYRETLPEPIKRMIKSSHPECVKLSVIDGCVLYEDFLNSTNTKIHIFDEDSFVLSEGLKPKNNDGSFSKKFKDRAFVRLPEVFISEINKGNMLWYLGFRESPETAYNPPKEIAPLFTKIISYYAHHSGRVFYYGVY